MTVSVRFLYNIDGMEIKPPFSYIKTKNLAGFKVFKADQGFLVTSMDSALVPNQDFYLQQDASRSPRLIVKGPQVEYWSVGNAMNQSTTAQLSQTGSSRPIAYARNVNVSDVKNSKGASFQNVPVSSGTDFSGATVNYCNGERGKAVMNTFGKRKNCHFVLAMDIDIQGGKSTQESSLKIVSASF